MSKPKAVTNSIANEVDSIFNVLLMKLIASYRGYDENELSNINHSCYEAKSALLTLIADRERKARLKEVYYLQTHCRPEMLDAVYIADRIKQLQAEDKGGRE